MTTILVTGGAGFIGSHTCKALAAQGYQPVAFDNMSKGQAEFVRWGPLERGDILDPAHLMPPLRAIGRAPSSISPHWPMWVNPSPRRLPTIASTSKVSSMCSRPCSGTGPTPSCSQARAQPTAFLPCCPSPRTRRNARSIRTAARSSSASKSLPMQQRRRSAHRGAALFQRRRRRPGRRTGRRHHPETHLIPLVIDAATGKGPSVRVFGTDYPTADGTCERDFIHVTDLASAHVAALSHLGAGTRSLTLNLGTGCAYSVRAVITAVERRHRPNRAVPGNSATARRSSRAGRRSVACAQDNRVCAALLRP